MGAITPAGEWTHGVALPVQTLTATLADPWEHAATVGDGDRWSVQARHDGEVFVLTVHPAHLGCYSGVSWLSLAATGELITCGANTAATAFVDPEGPTAPLLLPDPHNVGTYLSCAAPLQLHDGYW